MQFPMFMGASSGGGPPNPTTLLNSECSITWDNPGFSFYAPIAKTNAATLTINGNIRLVALLLVQSAQDTTTAQTYNYNNTIYKPSHVDWGPFRFVTESMFEPQILSPLPTVSSADQQIIYDLIAEMKKIKALKVLL